MLVSLEDAVNHLGDDILYMKSKLGIKLLYSDIPLCQF